MDNTPLPMKARRVPIIHESHGRVTRRTWQVKVILTDGTDVLCEHTHGHVGDDAVRSCAARIIAQINKAAGQ